MGLYFMMKKLVISCMIMSLVRVSAGERQTIVLTPAHALALTDVINRYSIKNDLSSKTNQLERTTRARAIMKNIKRFFPTETFTSEVTFSYKNSGQSLLAPQSSLKIVCQPEGDDTMHVNISQGWNALFVGKLSRQRLLKKSVDFKSPAKK